MATALSENAFRPAFRASFFFWIALAMAFFIFSGFGLTYWQPMATGTLQPLPPIVHLHGFFFSLWMLLLVGYTLALALTVFSREELVNLAWDSAGVTTGPVTVPLLMALGIGLGHVVEVADGFGILAMCSVGPIVSVLATGLWTDIKTRRRFRRTTA